MSIHFTLADPFFDAQRASAPLAPGWTNVPRHLPVWLISHDTEVQFADGSTEVWRVEPTIGFREIEVYALRKRPVRTRKYVVNAPKPQKPNFIPS